MMPRHRRDSHYCQPCGHEYANAVRENRMPKANKAAMVTAVYKNTLLQASRSRWYDERDTTKRDAIGVALQRAKRAKYDDSRYHALNIHSWIYRGTVECRLHTGTASYAKLAAWSMLWTAIVDRAYSMSESEIIALDGSSQDILLSLAPSESVRDYIISRTNRFN
jgi:hypothetical protein